MGRAGVPKNLSELGSGRYMEYMVPAKCLTLSVGGQWDDLLQQFQQECWSENPLLSQIYLDEEVRRSNFVPRCGLHFIDLLEPRSCLYIYIGTCTSHTIIKSRIIDVIRQQPLHHSVLWTSMVHGIRRFRGNNRYKVSVDPAMQS